MEPVIMGNRKFAIDLLKALLEAEAGNVLFSPLTVSSALGLVALGAKNNTEAQMLKGLHFDDRRIIYHDLYEAINTGGNNRSLKLVNHLYGDRSIDCCEDYLDKCEEWCFAGLRNVDFKANPEAARQRINNWVDKKTEGQSKDFLDKGDVTRDTKLVLLSAMHFKDNWYKPFTRCQDKGLKVQMMEQTDAFCLGEIPEADSRILELPYEHRDLSMFILLPNKSDGLPKLVDAIGYYKILEWTDNMPVAQDLYVKMPIFKLQKKYDLKNVLQTLGMTDVFSDKCDLSGMAPGPLELSKVVDETSVEVNEKGTEAGGGSGGVVAITHCARLQTQSFIADHPFLFFIRHNPTMSFLYWGRVIPKDL